MRKTPILALAGLVGLGILSVPVTSAVAAADDTAYLKRDDLASDLVLVSDDDDDDDDTGQTRTGDDADTDTNTGANTGTGLATRTRGRDDSRGNKVRDLTNDGGRQHVDRSRHHTNDQSRHNTRG